jgi:hypothetical protein
MSTEAKMYEPFPVISLQTLNGGTFVLAQPPQGK